MKVKTSCNKYLIIFLFSSFAICINAQPVLLPRPTKISMWLCADSATADMSGAITFVKDISGQNHHVIPSGFPPTLIENITALNGHNSIAFDGINDFLITTSTVSANTAFIVYKYSDAVASFPSYKGLITRQNSQPNYMFIGQQGGTNFYSSSAGSDSHYRDGGFRINNNVTRNNNPFGEYKLVSAYSNTIIPPEILTIGNNPYDAGNCFWKGEIAEIILYEEILTTQEILEVELYLNDKYASSLNLGPDINYGFCKTIDAGGGRSFLWNTGAITQSINVTNSGQYSVRATSIFNFDSYDTINISFPAIPSIASTTICYGSSMPWNASISGNYSYLWSNAETSSIINISSQGNYFVKVTDENNCFRNSNTVFIKIDSIPLSNLGPDLSLCSGNTISLNNNYPNTIYSWSNSATSQSIIVNASGQYWVFAQSSVGCEKRDTINVTIVGNAPSVNFASSTTCKNSPMSFTDSSTPPNGNVITNWQWSFGDNVLSTLVNPTHLYSDTGNYSVTLLVTTDVNCSNSITKNVRVHSLPKPNFRNMGLICSKTTVALEDSSSSVGVNNEVNAWLWRVNNSTYSDEISFHAFPSAGTHSITLTAITENNCRDSITKTVIVRATPTVSFFHNPACKERFVKFTNLTRGASTYLWNFGDASDHSSLISPNHIYSLAGTYPVNLYATSSFGCFNDTTINVEVAFLPTATFSFSNACINSSAAFSDLSVDNSGTITDWKWNFDALGSSSIQNPTFSFNATGNYQIKLRVTSSTGCQDSIQQSVFVSPLPITNFTFTPEYGDPPLTANFTNLSTGGATSFLWNFGEGNTSILNSPIHTFTDTGVFSIQLRGFDANGCSSSAIKTIYVQNQLIDLVLLDVFTSIDNQGYLTTTATIGNYGTRPITYIDFLIKQSGGESDYRELWTGNLGIAELENYTFKSSPKVNSDNFYICIEARNVNFLEDNNTQNNEICESIKNSLLELPNPYPNPSKDELNIPIILPLDGEVEIAIYNNFGKLIKEFNYSLIAGYNKIVLPIQNLSNGLYSYKVKYENSYKTNHFIISSN